MISVSVFYSEDFRLHTPEPYSHPENPSRLDRMLDAVRLLGSVSLHEPSTGSMDDYLEVHTRRYIEQIRLYAESGEVRWLDPDTYVSPGTLRAVEKLAGGVREAVDIIKSGEGPLVILGRPPGHHAGRDGLGLGAPTLGFCIVNTSALLAVRLHRDGRVTVLDFDAHHGNGTQDILWDMPIVHVDVHQDPSTIYPGTGFPWQTGGDKRHPKINIMLPPRSGDDAYRIAVEEAFSYIESFDSDYIVVSAGFDAYKDDTPFTMLRATSSTFHLIGQRLARYKNRTVIMVEGGYTVGLSRGLAAFLAGLLGMDDPIRDEPTYSDPSIIERVKINISRLKESLGAL